MPDTGIRLYNTLTRTKEEFSPIDPSDVRMYVCGPTVYDFAHIGNARPAIVFDVLFRLLRHIYGERHVTYVRNITDVDDKINARALKRFGKEVEAGKMTLNEAIRDVTEVTANRYREDVAALGCLKPKHEPRATEHIDGMVEMIRSLIDKGHAYVAAGDEGREVLFDVRSMPDYGRLSNRRPEDQQAGARVGLKDHKKNPGDFVLWKESSATEPGWDASFAFDGRRVAIHGRPGWHIECSAMSKAYLGEVFDIHGGGLDLIFPHHENEIAQSRCALGSAAMANVWMHNGFLRVEGRKMSKSEGNFVTIHDLLRTEKFGGRKWPGEVLRLAMLMTHYREPIDFSVKRLEEAEAVINGWRSKLANTNVGFFKNEPSDAVVEHLANDLDIHGAIITIRKLGDPVSQVKQEELAGSLALIGLAPFVELQRWIDVDSTAAEAPKDAASKNEEFVTVHMPGARQTKCLIVTLPCGKNAEGKAVVRWIDKTRCTNIEATDSGVRFTCPPKVLTSRGIGLDEFAIKEDKTFGKVRDPELHVLIERPSVSEFLARRDQNVDEHQIKERIEDRGKLIAEKNWAEADRIRDDLLARGIRLKDSKDPETGERVTKWEVKR